MSNSNHPQNSHAETTKLTDAQVVESVLAGRKDDFGILIQRYHRRIYGTVLRLLPDKSEADDAVQEVFMKAYRSLCAFHGDASFSTWLFRITVNHCLDAGRKRGRMEEVIDDASMLPDTETPEGVVLRNELWHEVDEAIRALPPDIRSVVALRLFGDLTYETIGEVLHIPPQTAKMRFFRAKKQLKKLLQASGFAL